MSSVSSEKYKKAQRALNSRLTKLLSDIEAVEVELQKNIINRLPVKEGHIVWTPLYKKIDT